MIFQCSKNYGSLTHVTWFKVAPNMADPISIKDSDSRLNKHLLNLLALSSEIWNPCGRIVIFPSYPGTLHINQNLPVSTFNGSWNPRD